MVKLPKTTKVAQENNKNLKNAKAGKDKGLKKQLKAKSEVNPSAGKKLKNKNVSADELKKLIKEQEKLVEVKPPKEVKSKAKGKKETAVVEAAKPNLEVANSKKNKKEAVVEKEQKGKGKKAGKQQKKEESTPVVEKKGKKEQVVAPVQSKGDKKNKSAPVQPEAPVAKKETKKAPAATVPQQDESSKKPKNKKQKKQAEATAPAAENGNSKKADAKQKPTTEQPKKQEKKSKKDKSATPATPEAEPVGDAEALVKRPAISDAPAFSEEHFSKIVTQAAVKKIVSALSTQVKEEASKKKSIFSDFRYILNVAAFKIANCPKRIVKLKLRHPLVDQKEDDIVLIVRDLQRGKKVDYEPTIHHYEDLLREKGVENVTILPFNQLRNEYNGFEMKRKLANLYDFFLCDGRIVSHAVGFLGTIFQKPRCTLHSVRLNDNNNLAREIKKTLHRTAYKQLAKGNLISIPVGSHKHSPAQVAENVAKIIEQLKTAYPGGWANIRNMHVRTDLTGTSALPIYMSMCAPPEGTPYVVGLREQKMNKLKREANEVLSKFKITADGTVERLAPDQVERKRKIKEARETAAKKAKTDEDEEVQDLELKKDEESEADDDDDEAEQEGDDSDDDQDETEENEGEQEGSDDEEDDDDDDEEVVENGLNEDSEDEQEEDAEEGDSSEEDDDDDDSD